MADILSSGKCVKQIGRGTYGKVSLYSTPTGDKVVKESVVPHQPPLGFPLDFITELDLLLKLRPLKLWVVQLEDFYLNQENRKGYLILEKMDWNLKEWSKKNPLSRRCQYLPQILQSIGSVLSLMHHFHLIHNDLKPNNILVKEDGDQMTFKLSDFGRSYYLTNLRKPYGGPIDYHPPHFQNPYHAEAWAFLVSMIEVIIGQSMIPEYPEEELGRTNTKQKTEELRHAKFYREHSRNGIFQLDDVLKKYVPIEEIPAVFWDFFRPLLWCRISSSHLMLEALTRVQMVPDPTLTQMLEQQMMRASPLHPKFYLIQKKATDRLKKYESSHRLDLYTRMMNRFLHQAGEELDSMNLHFYNEIALALIIRRTDYKIEYFTEADSEKYAQMQEQFLKLLDYQYLTLP